MLAKLLTVMLLTSLAVSESFAQDFVKGRVEKIDAPARLVRPNLSAAGLRALPTTAGMDSGKHSQMHTVELNINDFRFSGPKLGLPDWAKTEQTPKGPALAKSDINLDEDLIIAWEAWHRRISGAIYAKWLLFSTVPGVARVTVTVKRDGLLDWHIGSYRGPVFYDLGQEENFRDNIDSTLSSIAGDALLEFPAKSRRENVTLNTRFSSQMDIGPSGYSWRKGDYERISATGH